MKYKLLTLILTLSALISCQSVHEFPNNTPADPSLIDTEITLALGIDIEMAVDVHTRSGYTDLSTNYDVRYILDIYPYPTNREGSLGNRITRIIHTERELHNKDYQVSVAKSLKLTPKNYLVMVWVDFVPRGTLEDMHYDTHDLTAIKQTSGNGFHPSKDAFCASTALELAQFKGQKNVRYVLKCPLDRPFARYEIVATDLNKYIDNFGGSASYDEIRPSESTIGYELYLPQGFNVLHNVPKSLTSNVSYRFNTIDSLGKMQVILASDYVFVADSSYFHVDMALRNAQGRQFNVVNMLKINLKRNKKTIIYGDFLTKGIDGGSIGIDGDFGEEIIIPI